MSYTCTNCKSDFRVLEEDREFLKRFNAPDPIHCPDCRSQRRMAHRNETSLYSDTCDLCNKQMVSQYHPDQDLTVYCRDCWWSDKWDPYSYGREFDFSRPFFQQYDELLRSVPQVNVLQMKNENSEYTHYATDCKNCYLIFTSDYDVNCMYSNWVSKSRDSVDCFRMANSELAYECFFSDKLYNCQYMVKCFSARDSMFCYDSRNIENCVLSYNLRNAKFMILNQEYSPEEYEAKLKEMKLDTYSGRMRALVQFKELISEQAIHQYRSQLGRVENATGDYLRNVHNVHECFDLEEADNCRYTRNLIFGKDLMDCEYAGECEDGYQNIEMYPMANHSMATFGCYGGNNVYYSMYVQNGKNVLGSASVKQGRNIIFNAEYTEVEYTELFEKIQNHMLETGEWGQFFPIEHSLFGYNETNAQDWNSLTKEEAEEKGWPWYEDTTSDRVAKHTIEAGDLPETITEVQDDILKEVVGCIDCGKAYRITKQELDYYRAHAIPLPRKCYNCRYADRRLWHNSMNIAEQACTCVEADHEHDGHCSNRFMSSYTEGSVKNLYCENCYKAKLY